MEKHYNPAAKGERLRTRVCEQTTVGGNEKPPSQGRRSTKRPTEVLM